MTPLVPHSPVFLFVHKRCLWFVLRRVNGRGKAQNLSRVVDTEMEGLDWTDDGRVGIYVTYYKALL